MSGQPNRYSSDAEMYRAEYMRNLQERIDLDDQVLQAVKGYTSNGTLPAVSQLQDNRTTAEKLLDIGKLKDTLIKDLEPVMDPTIASSFVQTLTQSPLNIDNRLVVFLAQNATELVKELSKKYKYGIKGDSNDIYTFVEFINNAYSNKNNATASIKSIMDSGISNRTSGMSGRGDLELLERSIVDAFSKMSIVYNTPSSRGDIQHIFELLRMKIDTLRNFLPTEDQLAQLRGDLIGSDFGTMDDQILNKIILLDAWMRENLPNKNILTSLSTSLYGLYKDSVRTNTPINGETVRQYLVKFSNMIPPIPRGLSTADEIFDELQAANLAHNPPPPGQGPQPPQGGPGGGPPPRQGPQPPQGGPGGPGGPLPPPQPQSLGGPVFTPIQAPGPQGGQMAYQPNLPGPAASVLTPAQIRQQAGIAQPQPPAHIINAQAQQTQPQPTVNITTTQAQQAPPLTRPPGVNTAPSNVIIIPPIANTQPLPQTQTGIASSQPLVSIGGPASSTSMNTYLKTPIKLKSQVDPDEGIISKISKTFQGKQTPDEQRAELMKEQKRLTSLYQDDIRYIDEIDHQLSTQYLTPNQHQDIMDRRRYLEGEVDLMLQKLQRIEGIMKQLGPIGVGFKKRRGRPSGGGIKHGIEQHIDKVKGIEPDYRFSKFGKYLIRNDHLLDNMVSIRTGKGLNITGLPSMKTNPNVINIIKKIIGGTLPSFSEMSKLTEEEKEYLHKISKKSNILDKLNMPTPSKDKEEKDLHAFEVMRGEIMAGNDNKDMIHKFKALILRFSKSGTLPKQQVNEILSDLLDLGY